MNAITSRSRSSRVAARSGACALQEAIVASFALDREGVIQRIGEFDEQEWSSALEWLDVSGIALYMVDRIWRIGADCVIPAVIEGALADRLRRNRERMRSLVQEASALCGWFDGAGIRYAVLKGMTLAPESVPDLALRSQVDLDFLIAEEHRGLAMHYVHRLGYRLHAETRGSLEFRAAGHEPPTLASLYSARAQRALELHIAFKSDEKLGLLTRRVRRSVQNVSIYALSPADILVQQSRHLLKHLCGEYTRLSWVLEFRQHVLTRKCQSGFWREAEEIASEQANGNLAMAISFWLVRELFGDSLFSVPVQWQPSALPGRVRLWLERYARELLLGNPRPTKLYALLRNEVPCAADEKRSRRAILLPICVPARILDRKQGESVLQRFQRIGKETRFFLRRLRFHLSEGIRFGIEACRWNRAVARVGK